MSAHGAQADRRPARAAWLATLALSLLCSGQAADPPTDPPADPPPAAASAAPVVQFQALDVHDRREALADLLHRLALERDSRRAEHRAYIEATGTAQSLASLPDDEQKLRASMTLSADLTRLDEQLKESRLRRLDLLDRIQAQASQGGPASVEGARLLREADAEIRLMLSQQLEQARRTALLERQLVAFVNTIPPPAEFCAASGITMRLVGTGESAFYVNAAPLPVGLYRRFLQSLPPAADLDRWAEHAAATTPEAALTGVSWNEARRFCQWLSTQDGLDYRLPPAKEAAVLCTLLAPAGLAFWGGEAWNPDDHVARRDMKRFGVDLVTVWDPSAVLGPKAGSFGDVPFARYPSLTVYLVATRQTGVAHRWQRLKAPSP